MSRLRSESVEDANPATAGEYELYFEHGTCNYVYYDSDCRVFNELSPQVSANLNSYTHNGTREAMCQSLLKFLSLYT